MALRNLTDLAVAKEIIYAPFPRARLNPSFFCDWKPWYLRHHNLNTAMKISDLLVEIITQVIHLSRHDPLKKDIASYALVCQQWRAICQPVLFSTVTVHSELDLLQLLANNNTVTSLSSLLGNRIWAERVPGFCFEFCKVMSIKQVIECVKMNTGVTGRSCLAVLSLAVQGAREIGEVKC